MTHPSSYESACPPDLGLFRRGVLLLASLCALVLSGALLWTALTGSPLVGCGSGSGCDDVLKTLWGYWFGLPVSVLAILLYLGLLVGVILIGPRRRPTVRRWAWHGLIVAALSIVLAALWFVGLQAFSIGHWCMFCLGVHGCGLIVAGTVLSALPIGERRGTDPTAIAFRHGAGYLGLAVLGQGILLGGHFLGNAPATHQESEFTTSGHRGPAPGQSSSTAVRRSLSGKTVKYLRGDLVIHRNQFPTLGNPDAEFIVVEMFDYTCAACRNTAPMIDDALKRYDGQFAIALIPCPMNRSCNPNMETLTPDHSDACELARIGLAVWHAAPEQYKVFHAWIFGSEHPPTAEQAMGFAEEMIGNDELKAALASPHIGQDIQLGTTTYGNLRKSRMPGIMPKLIIISTTVINGQPRNRQAIYEVLERKLHLSTDRKVRGANP